MTTRTHSPTLNVRDRHDALRRMREEIFDLAIIGGGITGAGVARDAASRGMKVALIEACDFASGTSSRSSKLIHGGIRYLENLEFRLVFEALSERQRLFQMAPHLVHPLRFLIPVYKTGRVPAWKMGLGMWAYDALSLFEAPELHKFLSVSEAHSELPALNTQNLSGAFAYYDAYMDDDRLVHETLRSARAFGAEMANYARATGAKIENGRIQALVCRDQESGEEFSLRARHVVSSVGPWTDLLGEKLFKKWTRVLRPSKGVHITFAKSRFPLRDAVVMGAESRIVFAIPRHEMVIVGTTDTDFRGDPADVRAEREDIAYLLQVTEKYFPGAGLTARDILGCYAGVRPLIDDGARSESKTSREHAIWTDLQNVTFVAGGKYTTYRSMAAQTVREVLRHFSREERARLQHTRTLEALNPLVSGELLERARREHREWAREYGLDPQITALLADRHGLEAEAILARAAEQIPLDATADRSKQTQWMWCAEALHAMEHTMCLRLVDFYFRRTPLVLARTDHGLAFNKALAAVMGTRLNWSSERRLEEINALQNYLRRELSAIPQVDRVQ